MRSLISILTTALCRFILTWRTCRGSKCFWRWTAVRVAMGGTCWTRHGSKEYTFFLAFQTPPPCSRKRISIMVRSSPSSALTSKKLPRPASWPRSWWNWGRLPLDWSSTAAYARYQMLCSRMQSIAPSMLSRICICGRRLELSLSRWSAWWIKRWGTTGWTGTTQILMLFWTSGCRMTTAQPSWRWWGTKVRCFGRSILRTKSNLVLCILWTLVMSFSNAQAMILSVILTIVTVPLTCALLTCDCEILYGLLCLVCEFDCKIVYGLLGLLCEKCDSFFTISFW